MTKKNYSINYDKIAVLRNVSFSRQLVNGAVKVLREEGQWKQ